jgi:uncharacterized protein (TIGR02611 family)
MRRKVVTAARTTAGFALLLTGVIMLALPGPGLLTIAGGLALLAYDFPWAQRLLDRLRAHIDRMRGVR